MTEKDDTELMDLYMEYLHELPKPALFRNLYDVAVGFVRFAGINMQEFYDWMEYRGYPDFEYMMNLAASEQIK